MKFYLKLFKFNYKIVCTLDILFTVSKENFSGLCSVLLEIFMFFILCSITSILLINLEDVSDGTGKEMYPKVVGKHYQLYFCKY